MCSALSKVFDYVILEKYSDDLQSSNIQFAYKKAHSTIMCTAVLKEFVSHYNSNGSNVFACSLDATKAFDRVNYVKLFNLLLERNLPGVIIRLLFDSYSRQFVYTRWNSALSDPIPMENGVKQGGCTVPDTFVYNLTNYCNVLSAQGLVAILVITSTEGWAMRTMWYY